MPSVAQGSVVLRGVRGEGVQIKEKKSVIKKIEKKIEINQKISTKIYRIMYFEISNISNNLNNFIYTGTITETRGTYTTTITLANIDNIYIDIEEKDDTEYNDGINNISIDEFFN